MGDTRLGKRFSTASIRFRITALATAAVALVLIVAATAVVVVQRRQTISNLDASLVSRATDIMTLLDANNGNPDSIAGASGEGFVQLVAKASRVLAGTPALDHPIVPIPEIPGERSIGTFTGLVVDDDAFRVLTTPVMTAEGPAALIVGRSLDEVTDGIGILAASLAIAIPVIVIALTMVVWWLVGRTLAPVEAIRSEVADIGATRLDSRVPLPESRDEIHRLAETMNAMLDRLEHAVGAQQQFVADASHELRSPLARIRAELEIEPVEDETIESVREELIGLQNLVSDLLQLARFDAQQVSVREEVVDLDDLVFREGNNAKTEGTAVDMSGVAAVQTTGNRQQLGRAIRNLVENAKSHTAGSMALSLYEDGEFAVVTVADDGPGVPADQRDRIFERFARLDDARSQDAGGTGLGLAIAREIAHRHGGAIVIDGDYTAGARFVLRLPIYRS